LGRADSRRKDYEERHSIRTPARCAPSSTRALSCLLVGSNDPREHKVPERLIATGRPSSPPRIGGWTEAPTLGLASLLAGASRGYFAAAVAWSIILTLAEVDPAPLRGNPLRCRRLRAGMSALRQLLTRLSWGSPRTMA
jgi:hypothetical protein